MNDLEFLINRYIDGQASVDEADQLNELLRTDAKSRQIFVEHMNLDSALAEVAAGLPGKNAAVEDIIVLNRQAIYSNAIVYGLSAVAASFFLMMGTWFWLANSQRVERAQHTTLPTPAIEPIVEIASPAILVDQAMAVFATGKSPQSNKLAKGEYELITGVAQLRFEHGAEMILTGPAKFEIIDSQHTRVDNGKIRVIVPPAAKGFTVTTPAAEYIDLGTEFGLDVNSQAGTSDLYVLDGQVNVADKASKQVIEEVKEGDSNRFVEGVFGPAPDFVSEDFPTPNEIGYVRWQKHVEQMKQDPSLIAFYTFCPAANDSKLRNDVNPNKLNHAQSPIVSDGRIEGARWVSGRWPGKQALLFDGDNEFVEMDIDGSHQEMTIAAWLKIDRLDYEMNAILNSNYADDGDVHFQITRQGLPKGGLQGVQTEDAFIGDALQLGRWTHVAMVISREQRCRRVYTNGMLAREGLHRRDLPITPGVCRLANWYPSVQTAEKRVRAFRGKMDELAIWNRALSSSELQAIAEAGRQTSLSQD